MKRPLTCVNLIKAIGSLSVGQDPVRLSRAMANVIVAQMLPDGVVKGGAEVVGKKSWGKGVRIHIAEDNTLTIGCNIIVRYGESVIQVAKAVQEAITSAVESVTGVTVQDVDVNVCGIIRK